MTTDATLQKHVDSALDLAHGCCIITSPIGSESLTALEEGPRQHEGSPLVVVSLQKTSPRCFLLECAVNVVYVSVLNGAAVSLPMQVIEWHCLSVSTENSWLIHIIPEVV